MDNTAAVAADESLDSVKQSIPEALEDEVELDEIEEEEEDAVQNTTNSSLTTMETEDNQNNDSYMEEDEDDDNENDDGDKDEDKDDVEKEIKNFSNVPPSSTTIITIKNPSKDIEDGESAEEDDDEEIDEEEFCQNLEVQEDVAEQYVQDEQIDPCGEDVIPDKYDPFIVQDSDGMIKKIKLCSNKDLQQTAGPAAAGAVVEQQAKLLKTKILQNISSSPGGGDEISNKSTSQLPPTQPRSSTPMSREYLALQRSVNESKILTEFVSDTANEKPRKLRTKETHNNSSTSTTDHSYSSRRRSNNSNTHSSPDKGAGGGGDNNTSPLSQAKRHHSKRYAPLKYDDTEAEASSNLRPRSRSKSMHNSDVFTASSTGNGSHKNLKKWPSEERLHKRPNMRSENSEFVQKQMQFLQRVRCETPRLRSRSRSSGRKTPTTETVATVVVAGGNASGGSHQKSHKLSAGKERSSRRIKHEIDNDEQQQHQQQFSQFGLIEPMADQQHPDDVSVNESNTSVLGVSAIVDTTATDADSLDDQLKAAWQPSPKNGSDSFCWKCHEIKVNLFCCKCERAFHDTCTKMVKLESTWLCPDCVTVDNMLNNPKKSRRSELSLDMLSQLLSFALKRMRYAKGHYNFVMPYEESTIYNKYIVNPITLTKLQQKIEMKEYRCAEEMVNDTKWLLHNALILSRGSNTKTVMTAKALFKICRQEANEIETCAECYLNANTRTDWFVDVCSQPHLLLWAKLKGFPYWPAKAMGLGQNSLVNVRFFGEHDRAFVPLKDCYLYSEQDPNTATGKRAAKELADCIKEVQEHIERIRVKVGAFKYAAFKTPFEPAEEMKQLEEMMPGVQEFINRQQVLNTKPSLQFKIYKTADNNLSIVQKASTTPELQVPPTLPHAAMTTTSSDNEEKKKKSSLSESDSKYEVISKVTSEDSDSSKLSTVILKRKSVNGDSTKKATEDDTAELPLPKMTKIENNAMAESESAKANAKRKSETQLLEKPKAKHSKTEPKIPVLTIKTSITKEPNSEGTSKTIMEVATKDEAPATAPNPLAPAKLPETNDVTTETVPIQKVVEDLVKTRQGVIIIKKASKAVNSPEQMNKKETILPLKSIVTAKDKMTKQKADEEKAKQNQKVNNILKGLVPFVEVKKEVLSDNEQETEKQPKQNEKTPPQTAAAASTSMDTIKHANAAQIPQQQQQQSQECLAKEIATNNTTTTTTNVLNNLNKEVLAPNPPSQVMTQVKEEVFSDDEGERAVLTLNTSKSLITPCASTPAVEKQIVSGNNSVEVRVVGETTIQKLSCKQQQPPQPQQQNLYNMPSTSANAQNSLNNNNSNSKRASLRGIPYGPLPASAFPKTIASKTFQQNELVTLQPRAKKSFPQQSPPQDKLRLTAATVQQQQQQQSTSAQIISNSTSTTNSHLDPKKSMAKTTMVAIPVDVANQQRSATSVGNIIGTIPVPPLTAVSKTVPHTSVSFSSMARNLAPNTITVSSTISGSLTTPSVVVAPQIKTSTSGIMTGTSALRNSPITVASAIVHTSSSSSSSPASASLQTQQQTNQFNPLNMSTPPPLAGLSNSTLTNNHQQQQQQQQNGLNDSNPSTPSSSSVILPPPQPSSTDTHLLGGLVTPTLASAITDVICRGPPKLAVRPNGPLQSEGHPMFPSQAGPVCKRLVENVHKLTDFFISVVEDTMGEMAQGDDASLQAKITLLTMELERSKQAYEQEINELKRTSDLMLCEMRKSMENEKTRLAVDIRKQCEAERLRSIEETKRKQWCANCFREANFYCCWNTSYCDYPCQQVHWSRHALSCAQTRTNVSDTTAAKTTAAGSSNNLNHQQQERHHPSKANSSGSTLLNSPINYLKSTSLASSPATPATTTIISHKKEKHAGVITKNTSNIISIPSSSSSLSSPATGATTSSTSRTNTEVLKLPTNTYLRPVTSGSLNNQTLRCNTTYSLPVQRFNVPEKKNIKRKFIVRRHISEQSSILSMSSQKFTHNFGLNKIAFQYVLHKISPQMTESQRISNLNKLAVTMKILVKGFYKKINDGGGVDCGGGVDDADEDDVDIDVDDKDCSAQIYQRTVKNAFVECIELMFTELCQKWITYDMDDKELSEMKEWFYMKSHFPSVIGCLTNTHIKISPTNNQQYVNFENYFSINAMVVCDHKLRIRHISANPGRAEDGHIWNDSDLKESLKAIYGNGRKNGWLLGDVNYPLEPFLMTPFRSESPGTPEGRFNLAHSKARDWVVSQTIGQLKNRFKCLGVGGGAKPLHYEPKMCGKIIAVCAALHNICIHCKMEFPKVKFENERMINPWPGGYDSKLATKIRSNIMNNIASLNVN